MGGEGVTREGDSSGGIIVLPRQPSRNVNVVRQNPPDWSLSSIATCRKVIM